jgi:hypothetical protein
MKRVALVIMIVVFSVFVTFAASQAKPFKIAAIFQQQFFRLPLRNPGTALSIRPV